MIDFYCFYNNVSLTVNIVILTLLFLYKITIARQYIRIERKREKEKLKHTSLFFSADQLPYLSVYVSLQLCLVLIICISAKPCELDALNI